MFAQPVTAISPVDFFCGISVETSVERVQYCTGSYLSIAPIDQLGKQMGVRFYSMWHLH